MSGAKSAWEFALLLGMYWLDRFKESGVKFIGSFSPWNVKAFASGLAGMAYLVFVVAFLARLLYDGFAFDSERNFGLIIALGVVFAISLIT